MTLMIEARSICDLEVIEMIKVLSLFSGIGAFEKALEKQNIPYELLNYCELDSYASKAYSIIHGVSEEKNLHDVCKVNVDYDVDVLVHGSPCQSISISGKQEGAVKGSGTRSALIYESMRIIEQVKPKVIVYENVKNLLSDRHRPVFEDYLNTLEKLGYKNTYKVLNSKDFGVAQNRERIFVVSILGDKEFEFTIQEPIRQTLKEVVEDVKDIPDKYYLKDEYIQSYVRNTIQYKPKNIMKVGTILGINGHDILKRVYSQLGIAPTLTTGVTGNSIPKIIALRGRPHNGKYYQLLEPQAEDYSNTLTTVTKDNLYADGISIRKLTPLEYFRLQGFSDKDYQILRQNKFSDSRMYKMLGNSITVNVLEYIFKNLKEQNII